MRQIRDMIHFPLSLKLCAGVFPAIALLALALYLFSVPLIKHTVYELEEHAGRAVLETVFELASRIHLNLESHRKLALESHKARLKNIIEITSGYIDSLAAEVHTGELSLPAARNKLYETLRQFSYGNDDYIWIADYTGVLVSHPDPSLHGERAGPERDEDGRPVIPQIVATARSQGEGYYRYSWRRLGEQQVIPKISYFKNFPDWGFVVGTGVYLNDVERDMQRRRAIEVEDLRSALRDIKIGRTGYLYIFDSNYRMVIHPNPNIEGTYFGELVNPVTLKPIGSELVNVADKDVGYFYKWDQPEDPNNYIYDKISWVRHFDGFDWFIASSVYVSELKEGSEVLGNRIVTISFSFLVLSLLLSYLFVRRIMNPIKHLVTTAERVQQGDLSARSSICRNDEIGMLSNTFDNMVVRLSDNIGNLDAAVRERTSALQESNCKLQQTVEKLEGTRRDLAQAELRQRIILDAIPACVAQIDERYRIQFVNQRYADLFGTDKETLLGQSLPHLSDWETSPDIIKKLDQAQAGGVRTYNYPWKNAAGAEIILKTTLMPVSSHPDPAGLFVLALDVTEEKKAEKHLLEVQRMHAVTQLAAGLTHDFNNLLSIILGNLSSAEERYSSVDGLDEYLEPAVRATRRGADIIGRLLAFARKQPLEPKTVDVTKLLRSTVQLLGRSLPGNIELDLQQSNRPKWVFADPVQLENAIVNLALNAKDAMPQGGRLSLALSQRRLTDGLDVAGEYVEIKVIDNGHGFIPQALERAFEPFFTTKKTGAGSGLGLSMAFGFVKQSAGHIDIDSTEGQGTTVTILLPVVSAAESTPGAPESTVRTAAEWSGKLALVVEDDAEVRDIVRRQLVDLGFAVLVCSNAEEADRLVNNVEDLSLLVSDIVMPGTLNGLDLAHRVLASRPEVMIVLMTGFISDQDLATNNQHQLPILRKPFDRQALYSAIARTAKNVSAGTEIGA
ncbi:MAG: cache domain-containing protein [Candidatus Competibacteraceae bacterium]